MRWPWQRQPYEATKYTYHSEVIRAGDPECKHDVMRYENAYAVGWMYAETRECLRCGAMHLDAHRPESWGQS